MVSTTGRISDKAKQNIQNLYELHNDVRALVEKYEVVTGEHPVNVLNEIRYAISHSSSFYERNDDAELEQACLHLRRAKLDAFKNLCVAIDNWYKSYRSEFMLYDLSVVNNGEYIIDVSDLYAASLDLHLMAKRLESAGEKLEIVCRAWENACISFEALQCKISGNIKHLHRTKHKKSFGRPFEFSVWLLGIIGSVASICSVPFSTPLLVVFMVACAVYTFTALFWKFRK